MSAPPTKSQREELIRRYKTVLKDVVDRRPSGVRLKIAERIGRNKSFVSQITNPNYATPVPERHIELIFEAAHFTPEEKAKFLDLYRRAHPRTKPPQDDGAGNIATRVLRLNLPQLGSRAADAQLERLVRDFASRVADLVRSGR